MDHTQENWEDEQRPAAWQEEDRALAEVARLYTAGGDGLPPPPLESSEEQSD